MHATLERTRARSSPPRIPPRPPQAAVPGAADPEDDGRNAHLESLLAQLEDGETENGCDWPDGPLAPDGCRW